MNDQHSSFTEISELGEFGLIDHLTKKIKLHHTSTVKAFGDDAAVLDYKNKLTVASVDLFLEGIHFDLVYAPLHHLGYKVIVASISDIYAMNTLAEQVVVAIGVSKKFSVEMVDDLFMGMRIACDNYNVDLVGGDTCSSMTGLSISITSLGKANKSQLVYRDGAKNYDLLCVSGDLGGAYLGLQVLEREKRIYLEQPDIQPELSGNDYILQRHLKPEARKDIIQKLAEAKVKPTSMMDISDGLASEIIHITKHSNCGCKIFENKIPIDQDTFNKAAEFSLSPTVCALNGGEDYELLFTIKQKDYEKIKMINDIHVIGHITEKERGCKLITNSGSELEITAQGWNAFSN